MVAREPADSGRQAWAASVWMTIPVAIRRLAVYRNRTSQSSPDQDRSRVPAAWARVHWARTRDPLWLRRSDRKLARRLEEQTGMPQETLCLCGKFASTAASACILLGPRLRNVTIARPVLLISGSSLSLDEDRSGTTAIPRAASSRLQRRAHGPPARTRRARPHSASGVLPYNRSRTTTVV